MHTIQLSSSHKPGGRKYFARKIEVSENIDYVGDSVVRVSISLNPNGFLARRIKEIEAKEKELTGIEDPVIVIDRIDVKNCTMSITMINALFFRENEELIYLESLKQDTKERRN